MKRTGNLGFIVYDISVNCRINSHRLTLFGREIAEYGEYEQPQTLSIYGVEQLIALRDLLNELYPQELTP